MTVHQRDLLTLYCLHMGIKSPSNIKNHIREFSELRDIVELCDVEISNVLEKEKGTDRGTEDHSR